MMTGQEEILPPDPTVEGWWWLAIDDAKRPFRWVPWPATKGKTSIRAGFWRGILQDMSPEGAHKNRWKLIAPVATPEEVDALRAALEEAHSNNDNFNVEVTDLRAENAKLRRALPEAGDQFRFYALQHESKTPPDLGKAETNRIWAERCHQAIGQEPTSPPAKHD